LRAISHPKSLKSRFATFSSHASHAQQRLGVGFRRRRLGQRLEDERRP
jgi:hypothetical protein